MKKLLLALQIISFFPLCNAMQQVSAKEEYKNRVVFCTGDCNGKECLIEHIDDLLEYYKAQDALYESSCAQAFTEIIERLLPLTSASRIKIVRIMVRLRGLAPKLSDAAKERWANFLAEKHCLQEIEEIRAFSVRQYREQPKDPSKNLNSMRVKILMRACNDRIEDAMGKRLREAAAAGDCIQIKELLKKGAPVDSWDEWDNTPLYYAVLNRHLDAVEVLLAAHANVHLKQQKDSTILECAIKVGDKAIIELLLAAGADVKANPQPLNSQSQPSIEKN